MATTFKSKIFKGILIFLIGFSLLYIFRFIYSYTKGAENYSDEISDDFFDGFQQNSNRASEKFEYKKTNEDIKSDDIPNEPADLQISVEQKYEKVATLSSKSNNFKEDETKIRKTIHDFNSIIQFENNAGKIGSRSLHLSIGVPPEQFDDFVKKVKEIGINKNITIEKTDKTTEYKNINAHKLSLETTKTALIELKKQNGKIDEYINLESKIMEVDSQLREMGVLLGDYSSENEFCTVNLTLEEARKIVKMSMLHRMKVSFEWTIQYYLMFVCMIVAASFSVFFILLIIEKLKIFKGILDRFKE